MSVCSNFLLLHTCTVTPRRSRLEQLHRMRKVWCSNPSCDRPISRKNRYWQLQCYKLGIRCECQGSSEMTTIYGCPLSQYRCDTLRKPPCSMAMNAEHRLKFAILHLKRWRLHICEKFSIWTKKPKQNNILSQRPIVLFHLYPEQHSALPYLKVKQINKRISNWCIWYTVQ